jgi:hypothetical protein
VKITERPYRTQLIAESILVLDPKRTCTLVCRTEADIEVVGCKVVDLVLRVLRDAQPNETVAEWLRKA